MGEYCSARVLFGPVPGELGQRLIEAARNHLTPVERPDGYVPPSDPLVALVAAEGADMWDTDDGVVLEITDEQASYGLDQWFDAGGDDPDLDSLLIERGIPFVASDEGMHEIPGKLVRWQPGQERAHTVYRFDGEPMLPLSEFKAYAESDLAKQGDAILVALLQNHFGVNLPPHPAEVAIEKTDARSAALRSHTCMLCMGVDRLHENSGMQICDACYEARNPGVIAECEDRCSLPLDHDGLCKA